MPERNSKPSVEEVVDFSVKYICELFETNEDSRGVLHTSLTLDGEKALIQRFSLSDKVSGNYAFRRLYTPAYHVLLRDFLQIEPFPNGGGDLKSNEHYWKLNGRPLIREELRKIVLGESGRYIEANLKQCT